MKHYHEVGIADSVATFWSSPNAAMVRFGFQIQNVCKN